MSPAQLAMLEEQANRPPEVYADVLPPVLRQLLDELARELGGRVRDRRAIGAALADCEANGGRLSNTTILLLRAALAQVRFDTNAEARAAFIAAQNAADARGA